MGAFLFHWIQRMKSIKQLCSKLLISQDDNMVSHFQKFGVEVSQNHNTFKPPFWKSSAQTWQSLKDINQFVQTIQCLHEGCVIVLVADERTVDIILRITILLFAVSFKIAYRYLRYFDCMHLYISKHPGEGLQLKISERAHSCTMTEMLINVWCPVKLHQMNGEPSEECRKWVKNVFNHKYTSKSFAQNESSSQIRPTNGLTWD